MLTLEIATPTRLVIATTADEVVAPGSQGYFGVLPGHAPFLTTLGTGELTYRIGRDERHLSVSGGFVEVRNDKVIVLTDTGERPNEIDRARAERARPHARPDAHRGSRSRRVIRHGRRPRTALSDVTFGRVNR